LPPENLLLQSVRAVTAGWFHLCPCVFLEEERARELRLSGALLRGLEAELRSGDGIGIPGNGKQAS